MLLLLLSVRARGSTECGGGEETRKGGEVDTTAWWKGCIGFMQGRLSGLTAKNDLLAFVVIGDRQRFKHGWSRPFGKYGAIRMCKGVMCCTSCSHNGNINVKNNFQAIFFSYSFEMLIVQMRLFPKAAGI